MKTRARIDRCDSWYVLPFDERSKSICTHYKSNPYIPTIVVSDDFYDALEETLAKNPHDIVNLDFPTSAIELLNAFEDVKSFNIAKESHLNYVFDPEHENLVGFLKASHVAVCRSERLIMVSLKGQWSLQSDSKSIE